MSILTPAQRTAVVLLAQPGAEARDGSKTRWRVMVDRDEIGTVHGRTVRLLVLYGLLAWSGGTGADFRLRISDRGREQAARIAENGAPT
jgi:hypothetical protein